jgi:hypothetical protein
MKYIRSFYSVLTLMMVASGSVYAFADDDRGTMHRNLGYYHNHKGIRVMSRSPQLW